MFLKRKKLEALLPTPDFIIHQFSALGDYIGDNLMVFELYTLNQAELEIVKIRELIDQYAQDLDAKLNLYKTKLIEDVLDLNSRLITDVTHQK